MGRRQESHARSSSATIQGEDRAKAYQTVRNHFLLNLLGKLMNLADRVFDAGSGEKGKLNDGMVKLLTMPVEMSE